MRNFLETVSALVAVVLLLLAVAWGFRAQLKRALLSEYLEKQDRIESNIEALNDSIRVVSRNEREITYQIRALEGTKEDIEELLTRPEIGQSQRQWLRQLRDMKNLVSSLNVRVTKMDSVVSRIGVDSLPGVRASKDSLSVLKGTVLQFREVDTTQPMQWTAALLMDDPLLFDMSYEYNLDLELNHKRQSDGSIMLDFRSSDPSLDVSRLNSYVVPPAKQRTRVGRWIYHNRRWIYVAAGGASFVTGFILGVQ